MRKVYLSNNKKIIAGVCGGIGEAYNFDPIILRLVLVFTSLVTSIVPVAIVYALAWAVLPNRPASHFTDAAWSSE